MYDTIVLKKERKKEHDVITVWLSPSVLYLVFSSLYIFVRMNKDDIRREEIFSSLSREKFRIIEVEIAEA